MHYFVVRTPNRNTHEDFLHYFIVKSKSPIVPEKMKYSEFEVVASVTNEKSLAGVKNLFSNCHMREWVKAWGCWPIVEGWH